MGKDNYRIRNWSQYNKSLTQRGSITFWFSEDVQQRWCQQVSDSLRRGRPMLYSDTAILCALTIRAVFNLPLRATEGFLASLIQIMRLDLPCPNYSTLCRRAASLSISLPKKSKPGEPLHVLVDSTGLKIYGEGEWKTRQHGISKRRTWRKMHLAINRDSYEILSCELTSNNITDDQAFPSLLKGISAPILSVCGDGAYDKVKCYHAIYGRKARAIIPPRRGAQVKVSPELFDRVQAIVKIHFSGCAEEGRKRWKQEVGDHKRSRVETQMGRFKGIFGGKLRSRSQVNQKVETMVKCRALNLMTGLGMPKSYKRAA